MAPDLCSCRVGFIGTACEQDLDECATGLHGCRNTTSQCINMPGWYYCRCKPGYKSTEAHGTECVDIDECYHNVHSCHATATCVNTAGHFECHCPSAEEDPECRLSEFSFLIGKFSLVLITYSTALRLHVREHGDSGRKEDYATQSPVYRMQL